MITATLALPLPKQRLLRATLLTSLLMTLPLVGYSATSSPQKWQLDVPKTNVDFTVKYLGGATVDGAFHKAKGSISYDVRRPAATSISFTVQSNSIDTGMSLRDHFLRRKELLNSAQYPTLNFVSKKVEMINPKEANVTGHFTALGHTKPLTVRVTLSDLMTDPRTRKPILKFRATGVIDRLDYGVTAFPNLVGTKIPLNITGQLTPVD